MKTFFSRKKILSWSYFVIFPNFKIFWFFAKKLIIRAEKTFLRNHTTWYAFYSKFATFIKFGKISSFLSKNSSIFSKKNLSFERCYFSRILRKICFDLVKKTFTFRNMNEHRERNWQISGKKSELDHLNGRFCFHILKNMAQNNELHLRYSSIFRFQSFALLYYWDSRTLDRLSTALSCLIT